MKILITHKFGKGFGGSYLYIEEIKNFYMVEHKVVCVHHQLIDHNFDCKFDSIEDKK